MSIVGTSEAVNILCLFPCGGNMGKVRTLLTQRLVPWSEWHTVLSTAGVLPLYTVSLPIGSMGGLV